MATEVTLPALGESVTEGTISRWLKAVGDRVEVDEALVEVSTDKVDTEVPSPVSGVILEIRAEEDATVPVGSVMCVVGEESEVAGGGEPSTGQESQPEQGEPQGMQPDQGTEPKQDASDPTPVEHPDNLDMTGAPTASEGTEVTLPALGESVTEGTISRWLKSVGESVEADEPLVEVSTDKVDTEIPSPAAGTLLEIRVQEDEVATVGQVLAIVGDAAAMPVTEAPKPVEPVGSTKESMPVKSIEDQHAAGDEGGQKPIPVPEPEPKQPEAERAADGEAEKKAAVARRAAEHPEGEDDLYVTPLVRKLAAEHGVNLSTLVGTGVGGRIRKQDVLAAAEGSTAAPAATTPQPEIPKPAPTPATQAPATAKPSVAASGAPLVSATPSVSVPAEVMSIAPAQRGTTEKMSRLRATIAKRMVESLQVSAQLTATVEVDLTEISRLRAQVKDTFKAREGVGLSYLPFITKVAVECLKQFPKLNATIDTEAGTITYNAVENIGIAVDTERGLLVPVIKNAGDLNISGLAKQIVDLADRTRNNKVTPDDLTGGTFTITNYGSAGALFDTPIINQPQVGILGTGAIVKRPVVMKNDKLGESIVARDMMFLSLSYDHRLVDGADAARFLSAMKARLEGGDFGSEFGL